MRFDTTFIGGNMGFSTQISESKRTHYQIDLQYHKQFFKSTFPNTANEDFYYERLTINRLIFKQYDFSKILSKTSRPSIF
jgi:hypothetical protein